MDERVFAEIYPALRRFAGAVSEPTVDPDDLVQEAIVRTLRGAQLSELDDPASYLRRAVLNLARNQHRDTTRQAEILQTIQPATASVDSYPSEFTDLSLLTADQRAVLYLRFVEQLTTSEIADLLEVSEDTVRARSSRAIKALRLEHQDLRTADEQP